MFGYPVENHHEIKIPVDNKKKLIKVISVYYNLNSLFSASIQTSIEFTCNKFMVCLDEKWLWETLSEVDEEKWLY